MAIVLYKCDTCKRTKEIERNISGLETVGRCTITYGCRGKLYQEKLLPDYIRGSIPKDVSGLDPWVKRKIVHDHQQAIESEVWTVHHEMGVQPSVIAYVKRPKEGDVNYVEKIEPSSILVVDENTVKLVFERAYSGYAQLYSNQSNPIKPNAKEDTTQMISVTDTVAPQQISNMGEITIATRAKVFNEVNEVTMRVAYLTTDGNTPVTEHVADNQPSIYSAWVTEDLVYIKGEVYTVRSYNGITNEMYNGVINSGSTFQFTGIDPQDGNGFKPLERNDAFILLAQAPYETVDKLKNHVIDVSIVSDTKNKFGFYYADGEFFANAATVESVYPSISINQ